MAQSLKHVILSMGFSAASDMSVGGSGPNSSFQYCGVKLTTTAWQVDKAGAAPALMFGILQNQPKLGSAAEVAFVGVSLMVVDGNAGAIVPGDRLTTDASSRGVKTTTDKAAFMAIALEPSVAANDIISVFLVGPGENASL